MISILLFFLGLFIGSFLLVAIERIPRGESILMGRSHCDMCGHTLAWYDLVPIFSYIFLRGRCRYCHKSYGLQYPFVELVTAGLFSLTPLIFQFTALAQYIFALGIISSLLVIFFTDMYVGIIPDVVLATGTLFVVAFLLVTGQNLFFHAVGALVAGVFFLLLYIVTRQKGVGFGDVKYAFFMGLLLGLPNIILGLYIAFLTGAIVALILIVGKRKHFHKDTISFGPFLVFGTYLAWGGGIALWHFFLHFLFGL